ncbi:MULTISPECIES: DUF3277 family protein [Lactobacillus]|uniref:DUF3277 family protein n=1 Tax=Lactobacillus xujianguonis TaxID=2495899 RepID=A0A437STJ1_9LACO|nr:MULTISPECIES: DUF3277 family protein [Lactobacillus]RVU70162.1 DUF3277 family protein [Lactobacillus xujianguonis]RVU73533.1 DUF3277 family protein [Lactobacillus xujianguonis]
MANFNSAQTGVMATYKAVDTTVMVNGKQIFGYGEDTMFTASYDNDTVTIQQDPQGTGVASENAKTGATITLNISESSPVNSFLNDLASTNNFPVDIVTTTNHIHAVHCYIQKKPDIQGAATASNRAWVIKAINMDDTPLVS